MSVRTVRLNRVSGPRPRRWHGVFAAISILSVTAAGVACGYSADVHRSLLDAIRAVDAKRRVAQAPPAPPSLEQLARIRAVTPYVAALNLPWDRVLRAVRPPKNSMVYLFALDAEPESGRLRVRATTAQAEAMTDYVAALAAHRSLADVYLVKHEIPKEGGYRFEV